MEAPRPVIRAGLALAAATVAATAAVVAVPSPAQAGTLPVQTRLVTRDNAGDTLAGTVQRDISLSDNGRFVAFVTGAAIVSTDTNGKRDVYVRDLWAGTTDLVSLTDADKATNGDSFLPSISDDGRFVAFLSDAANLVPGDDKGFDDVFLRDRYEGTTRWLSPAFGGGFLGSNVGDVTLSGDGTVVAFVTRPARSFMIGARLAGRR